MLKKYLLDTSGNFSIMFGIGALVLLLGVGVAVDVTGATSQKTTLQSMSDAATLAAAASKETDLAILEDIIIKSLEANNFDNIAYTYEIEVSEGMLTLVVNNEYNTKIMGFAGTDKMNISALSAAPFGEEGIGALNLALVLDSTHSMQGANMTNLQIAATNLVDSVEEGGEDIHMSVVPFATYVNVGTEHAAASWADIPAPYTLQKNKRGPITNPGLCRTETYERQRDGITTTETREVCEGRTYGQGTLVGRDYTWRGCMGSRDGIDRTYPEHGTRRIPGINHYSCGTPLLPLTDNYNDVRNTINAMNARDETYVPTGLMWGWRTLDSRLPFNEASLLDNDRERAMILMTDGHNVKSQGARRDDELARPEANAFHEQRDGEQGDAFTAELCSNIKNDGIRIFVIAYKLTGADTAGTQSTLRNCATSSADFYDAQNGAQLDSAFQAIGGSLAASVRLSR